jgi:hypothetical protein
MPNNSQSKLTTDLMTMRAQYNLLNDQAERLLIAAVAALPNIACTCGTEHGPMITMEDGMPDCPKHQLEAQIKHMVKPGSPLEGRVNQRWIKGELNR